MTAPDTFAKAHAADLEAQQPYAIRELEATAKRVAAAQEALEAAREAQRQAVRAAAKFGLPETQIALHGSLNRMTVRAALGK